MDHQMEVDSTDSMLLVTAEYSLELVPRIDDSNTHFSDLSPMERCKLIIHSCTCCVALLIYQLKF